MTKAKTQCNMISNYLEQTMIIQVFVNFNKGTDFDATSSNGVLSRIYLY